MALGFGNGLERLSLLGSHFKSSPGQQCIKAIAFWRLPGDPCEKTWVPFLVDWCPHPKSPLELVLMVSSLAPEEPRSEWPISPLWGDPSRSRLRETLLPPLLLTALDEENHQAGTFPWQNKITLRTPLLSTMYPDPSPIGQICCLRPKPVM